MKENPEFETDPMVNEFETFEMTKNAVSAAYGIPLEKLSNSGGSSRLLRRQGKEQDLQPRIRH
jgi:hypothetical protein